MEVAARDDTEDWLLPELARPPLIGEIEQRIDLALATARASEAAVTKVGGVALDAAEQARHAAELAERASRAPWPPGVQLSWTRSAWAGATAVKNMATAIRSLGAMCSQGSRDY